MAEDLDTAKDISPLEPFKTYGLLPTPSDSFGAGAVLIESIAARHIIFRITDELVAIDRH